MKGSVEGCLVACWSRSPILASNIRRINGCIEKSCIMGSYCMISTAGSWKFSAVFGIIGLLFGAIFLFFPHLSLTLVIYLFAAIALIAGILLLAAAAFLAKGSGGFFAVPLVLGVIAVILAVYSFLNPESTATFIAIVIGAGCLIAGLIGAFTAIFQPAPATRRALLAVGGFVLAGLGIIILLFLQRSVLLIFQLLGAFLMIAGAVALIGAVVMMLRRRPDEPDVIDAEFREV
ncbi:MAG TPA: DUF308 domain-containing protein [Methanoregulaceae archaeon]|nr:DUF308 domain-containing protein [Methanoregulaceae archaeon]